MKAVYNRVYDFSVHNGRIDWDRLKKAGVDFVMLRAGYGKNNIDERFYDNAMACTRLEIPFGIYWFSYAYTEEMAEKEAEYALEAVKKYRLSCPVAYDLEYDTVRYARTKGVTIEKNMATAMAEAFCSRVERAGYMAVNYSNQDYLKNMFDECLLLSYPLWYARYNRSAGREDMVLWQYSSEGAVAGVAGRVDMNYAYKELPSRPVLPSEGFDMELEESGVTEYSYKKDGNKYFYMDGRQTNFRIGEFRCKDGSDSIKVDAGLVRLLQQIRDHFGKAVIINSAYRTKAYNSKINGASRSKHLDGMAADIRIEGITPLMVAMYAESIGVKGIGMYGTFVHVDTRNEKYYWVNQSGHSVSTFGGSSDTGKNIPGEGTVLKKGSRGEDVVWLQERLNAKNICLEVDGKYGENTRTAVMKFQKASGIKEDGIAGPVTINHLAM